MKAITREWLNRAEDDLLAAKLLLAQPELTNMVAFHAQQAVERYVTKFDLPLKQLKIAIRQSDTIINHVSRFTHHPH